MQETLYLQETLYQTMQEYLFQTADAGDSLADAGVYQTADAEDYQSADAGVSPSDSGCRRLSIIRQTVDAGVSLC